MQTQTLTLVGKIATALGGLQLELLDAAVSVRHEEREDISINVNYPSCWKIDGNVVRQTKVMVPSSSNTVIMGSGFFGGGVFVGGNNGGAIAVGRGGVHVAGRNTGSISVGDSRTTINAGGRSISVENGEVWVDGKKVTDSSGGSEHSSSAASQAKPTAPDRLEIVVPLSYRGDLNINNPGDGNVEVDAWQGGDFIVAMSGCGDIKAGALSDVRTVDLRSRGTGDIEIASLNAASFVGALSGTGDLEVEELHAATFSLRQSGTGDATIASGSAQSGTVTNSGTGDTSMRGRFGAITKRNTGCGDIKIRVRE